MKKIFKGLFYLLDTVVLICCLLSIFKIIDLDILSCLCLLSMPIIASFVLKELDKD